MTAHDYSFSPPHEHEQSVHPSQCIACLRRPSAEAPRHSIDVQAIKATVPISSTVLRAKVAQSGDEAKPAPVNVKVDAATIYAKRAREAAASRDPIVAAPSRKSAIDANSIYGRRRADINRNPSPPAGTVSN